MRKLIFGTMMLVLLSGGLLFAGGAQEPAQAPASAVQEGLGEEYYSNQPGERTFSIPTEGVGLTITTDVKADAAYSLACMVKNATNPYMVKMLEGAKQAAADMGCDMVTLGPTKADSIEEQVRIVEDLIQKGVQGFILHPSDSNGIMPAVRKATAKNIPIATIGTPAAEPTFLRSGVDYYQTGRIIAQKVAEELGFKGKIIVLEGAPGAQNGQERLQGIVEEFAQYPEMEIIASQTANWNRVQGMQVMENLLQRFDTVDGVIGNNDEMAIGAIQALKAAGLSDVVVAGFDANKDACLAIKNGEMLVSYNTDPFGSSYLATVYLIEYLNDGTLPPRYFIPFPDSNESPLIDKTSVDAFMNSSAWWLEN